MQAPKRRVDVAATDFDLDAVRGQRYAPAAFYPRERTPGSHCTGGWVSPRAGVDTEDRGKAPAGNRTLKLSKKMYVLFAAKTNLAEGQYITELLTMK
jgi:hypothetical protein